MEKTYEDGYKAAYKEWIEELGKVMPADFKDWYENCDKEKPLVARLTIESLIEREKFAMEWIRRWRNSDTIITWTKNWSIFTLIILRGFVMAKFLKNFGMKFAQTFSLKSCWIIIMINNRLWPFEGYKELFVDNIKEMLIDLEEN